MKHTFFVIFIPISLLLACTSHKSSDSNKNDTIVVADEIISTEPLAEDVEKTESLDSIYKLEKEPDISIEIKSLPFEPDFAYVANSSLFLGEKENLKPEKIPINGEVLSFTWSPDRKFIYFALKTELNKITKKEIEKRSFELEGYDLKIYKFDLQKPYKAEYITTLFDRTSKYPEGNYFLDYGNPSFEITCHGDTLIVPCEPVGGEGGFYSSYIVSVYDRKTILFNEKRFNCKFPRDAELIDKRKLEFEVSGNNMIVFYNQAKELGKTIILSHISLSTLFKKHPLVLEDMNKDHIYSRNFNFSISPSSQNILFSAFMIEDMDEHSGTTYIYNKIDSTTFEISSRVVLGAWFGAENRWLPNDNLLIYSSKYKELYIINTEKKQISKIEDVISFQAAPF